MHRINSLIHKSVFCVRSPPTSIGSKVFPDYRHHLITAITNLIWAIEKRVRCKNSKEWKCTTPWWTTLNIGIDWLQTTRHQDADCCCIDAIWRCNLHRRNIWSERGGTGSITIAKTEKIKMQAAIISILMRLWQNHLQGHAQSRQDRKNV